MKDPCIITKCGHTFDRKDLLMVLEKFSFCPVCRTPATKDDIVINFGLRSILQKQKKERDLKKKE